MDGLQWTIPLKWRMTRGTPIFRNPHVYVPSPRAAQILQVRVAKLGRILRFVMALRTLIQSIIYTLILSTSLMVRLRLVGKNHLDVVFPTVTGKIILWECEGHRKSYQFDSARDLPAVFGFGVSQKPEKTLENSSWPLPPLPPIPAIPAFCG